MGTSILNPNIVDHSLTNFDGWVRRVQGAAPDYEVTWADYYCGAGGSSQGIEAVPGARVVLASNHWDLAIRTHQYNHPLADHDQADITGVDPRRHPRTDFAWFSPECFPAGTTILTRRGPVPIENVKVGDEVLTHRRRWRRVTRTMSKMAETVIVSGYGHARLETTADHPFYARRVTKQWDNTLRQYRRRYDAPEWVRAGDLKPAPTGSKPGEGHMWSSPTTFGDAGEVPPVRRRGITFDADFWWLVGRWLGDGCLRAPRGDILVTCGHHEANDLGKRLDAVAPASVDGVSGQGELRWLRRDQPTAVVFTASHIGLMEWLRYHFGQRAAGKRIPAWALAMRRDWREALLEGYVSADGGQYTRPEQRDIIQTHTVSRALAVGVRLLALSLGLKASMSVSDKRTEGVIEGRRVNMRPLWRVHWCADPSPSHDQTLVEDGHRWAPVRKVEPGRKDVKVFNLSVDGDESYIVDGIDAHNCTTWSIAKGEKCDYDGENDTDVVDGYLDDGSDDDPERPLSVEAKVRSRVQMRDVVRFSAYHRYKAVIVENVPDILKWKNLDRWIGEMHKLGYKHKVLTVNSAFAQGLGAPAPQLRDRVYVVFWLAKYPTPNWDKWLRPHTWCPKCLEPVRGIFNPKPGKRRPMRYGRGAQYSYRCPKKTCGSDVEPFVLPALSAINLGLPIQRIGDRKRPLKPNTRLRVGAAVMKYRNRPVRTSVPMLVPCGGSWNDSATFADNPMRTRTTRENEAVLATPDVMTLSTSGREGSGAPRHAADTPFRTQTARHEEAVVVAPQQRTSDDGALYVPLRNNGVGRPAAETTLKTIAAGGGHHALVMRYKTGRGDESRATPVTEPVRTLQANGGGAGQAILTWDNGRGLFSYDTGNMRPLSAAMPTQTTIEGDALVEYDSLDDEIDNCSLRMLTIPEINDGMAFRRSYVLLGDAKRDKVTMLGNAVTPPAARDLVACIQEAILGYDYPLHRYDLALAA